MLTRGQYDKQTESSEKRSFTQKPCYQIFSLAITIATKMKEKLFVSIIFGNFFFISKRSRLSNCLLLFSF